MKGLFFTAPYKEGFHLPWIWMAVQCGKMYFCKDSDSYSCPYFVQWYISRQGTIKQFTKYPENTRKKYLKRWKDDNRCIATPGNSWGGASCCQRISTVLSWQQRWSNPSLRGNFLSDPCLSKLGSSLSLFWRGKFLSFFLPRERILLLFFVIDSMDDPFCTPFFSQSVFWDTSWQ